MALDGENLIAAKCHRVFGQIHDGIAKGQNAALKNADWDTCQITKRCTEIL